MVRRIIGSCLIASPFIAVVLLPLYTEATWGIIGIAFGLVVAVAAVFSLGSWLLGKAP